MRTQNLDTEVNEEERWMRDEERKDGGAGQTA
jgi:hypothetical protein